ncbi:MAG: aminomethyl-transferring glycine dehydrogenase subunit GcvPB [Rhizobiales bacterium]|nr:aminomethyl-transferring glycine dehydrogenase subunit GcvPB [Hyphomicrobiales bacterium]
MLNNKGRVTRPQESTDDHIETQDSYSGHKGLLMNEPLLFEVGGLDKTGVDLPDCSETENMLGGLERAGEIGLPGLSEPEAVRHYVRLSQQNYAIDSGFYPLGSCTMKHNPRLNEKMARLPGFTDIHPLQPQSSVQGALQLMEQLSHWLLELTGMEAIALSPKAGAHGELCGMMAIKAALEAADSSRNIVLVPESAHGTNPATAAQLGFKVASIPADADGTVRAHAVQTAIEENGAETIAGIMLTNPNTCGLFEREIKAIADAVHEAGGYFYCDGANFNAIMGRVRPGDLGVDAMHFNLHKTFSTPHGGGGPGSGPVVLSQRLSAFAPVPFLQKSDDGLTLIEHEDGDDTEAEPFGRLTAFHGQMGMYVRALSYILSHGLDGLAQASGDAVLNANYVRAKLKHLLNQPFGDQACMHEVLFDESSLAGTGVTTLDIAKRLIDEGFHPMTIYFPLVCKGAMLIEPTESESQASIDLFVETLASLIEEAKAGETEEAFHQAPVHTPRRRLDETAAARKPILRFESSSN